MPGELLLVQLASVEAVLDLPQIQEEVIVGHAVMAEQPLLGVGPEGFNAVDRGRATDVLARPVTDGHVAGKLLLQAPVTGKGVEVGGGFDRDVVPERGLELGAGGIGHQVHVDDPVGPLVDAEDHVLEVFGSPSTLDLSGLPKLRTLAGSTVLEARPKVGLVDLDLPVQQSDGLVLERPDRPPELEEETMDAMVGHLHPPSDIMVGQPELEPEEQLVNLQQGKPCATEPGAAEQAKLFPTPLTTLPAAVGELPELTRVAALDAPGPVPEPSCTRNGPNSCVTEIAGEDSSHRVLKISQPHES